MEPNLNSMQRDGVPSWEEVEAYLRATEPGSSIDHYIDDLAERVFAAPNIPQATQALVVALGHAQSSLTRRSVALALALCAASESSQAVDALVVAYRQCNGDPFLAPSLLDALSILALRTPLARAETTAALLRLNFSDSRHLLVRAAKVIGRLDNAQTEPALRDKLRTFCTAPDLAIQSEAHYQLGLITLTEAFLVSDRAELKQRLIIAQAAFVQAEMTEEVRDDAALFHILIDAILAIHTLSDESEETARRVEQDIERLQMHLQQFNVRLWKDYRSPYTDIMAVRVLSVVEFLKRAIHSANTAENWTNFDAALIELATLHTLICSETPINEMGYYINTAIGAIADRVLLPHLGPVVMRAVGRRRLALVVENYRLDPEHDTNIAASLQALEQIAILSEIKPTSTNSSNRFPELDNLTKSLNSSAEEILQNFLDAVGSNSVDRFIEKLGLAPVLLPIDQPGLYGSDPTIDNTVRSILYELRHQLDPYPIHQWYRLVETIESLVSFVHLIRDIMPEYTRCTDDKGKGQSASERDLQDHLFASLRLKFNRNVSYEYTPIGGGRSDNGLRFEECFFPIEVKHEFNSIEPRTIHEHYLTQTDIYAAATDRVAFLMVLDLRHNNAAGHVNHAKKRRRSGQPEEHSSLYSLEDGFWVDTLPLDPQLPHMKTKAVIIGLVPGNRPRPSSTTTYSKRPATARKQHPT